MNTDTETKPAIAPLLAFSVTAEYLDVNILVFATDRTQAKQTASRCEWISNSDVEWVDLRVTREPKADKYAPKFGAVYLDANTPDEQRVLRELGWYQLEGAMEECSRCHLCQWDLVPESKLEDVGEYVCAGCLKENKS